MVLSLAVADVLVCVSSSYYLSFNYLCRVAESLGRLQSPCLFRFAFTLQTHTASGYSLIAIAVDRYMAVVHALSYRRLMNNRRTTVIIAAVWLLSLLNGAAIFLWNDWDPSLPCLEEHVFSVAMFGGVILANFLLVLCALVASHWRVHAEAVAVTTDSSSRSARIALLVAGGLILSFLPLVVVIALRVLQVQSLDLGLAQGLAFTVSKVNFVVNPFVYSWKNTAIRAAMVSEVRRWVPCRTSSKDVKTDTRNVNVESMCASVTSVSTTI